jgi:hypothetical protein
MIYCIGSRCLGEANDVFNCMEVVMSCRSTTSLACATRRRVVGSLGTVAARLPRVVNESASRPPSGFWCLNNKTIKELMTFAECETEKCLRNYIESIRYSRHIIAMIITYLCMSYDRKKSSNEKEEIELIIYVSCQLAP